LYYLLTGRPPFVDEEQRELIRKVRECEFRPPREVKTTVDRALDAVCRKAMALRPEDRYPSARALADDLERWLADQAVAALREGRAAQAARWLRHHRAWTRAGAAALLTVAVVSTTASLAVNRAWSFEHRAHIDADSNFALAHDAVDRLLTKLAEGRLAGISEADDLRRQVAEDAAEFNDRFLKMRPRDPAVRRNAAAMFREVGNIYRLQGLFREAVASYDKSIGVLEELVADFPGQPQNRDLLAETLNELAEDMRMAGRPKVGEPYCRKALAVVEALLAASPDSVPYRKTHAGCLNVLAMILTDTGRFSEGQAAAANAVGLRRPMAESPMSAYFDQLVFGLMLSECGRSFRAGGNVYEAEKLLIEAIDRLGALSTNPLDANRLGGFDGGVIRDNATFLVAYAQMELAHAYGAELSPRQEALRKYDAAIATLNGLVRRSPIPYRRRILGLAHLSRGLLRQTAAESESDCNEARRLFEKLVHDSPHDAIYQGLLARVLERQGKLSLDKGDRSSARSLLQDALTHTQAALDANPDSPDDRENLVRVRKDLEAVGERAAR
jgi:tetratricopeptide (TPR) repeat protein